MFRSPVPLVALVRVILFQAGFNTAVFYKDHEL